jgi:cysteine dioxygenase
MQPYRAPLVTPSSRPLAQLVEALRGLGDLRRHADAVDALLDGISLPLAALLPSLRFRGGVYTRTRIHRDDDFELLLLTWSPGSQSPVHDHDGQDCWFVPLAGDFTLDDYVIADDAIGDDARLTLLRSRRLGPGELDRRDQYEAVHAVRPASPIAISLHVYAQPIDRCRVFDLRRGTWQWRRITCDAEAPLLAGG